MDFYERRVLGTSILVLVSVHVLKGCVIAVSFILLEPFLYDLEMQTREQNRNDKRTEIERFDSFVERIQTCVAFEWLSEHSGEKTSCPRTF